MPRLHTLLDNNRFWILSSGIVASILIAGLIQLAVPSGSLQAIRMEQYYGFIALALLYLALVASPLTTVLPRLPFKPAYLHARRAVGVLACYYTILHVYITFFKQLDGFTGIKYFSHTYNLSLLCGASALGVLCILALTSMDWVIRCMGFKQWKLLQRLVYGAGVVILVHVVLIGTHYEHLNILGIITYAATGLLLILESVRIALRIRKRAAGATR